jgi:hypothetical protein
MNEHQGRANAAQSKWAFVELYTMITPTAQLNHSIAIKVNAHYTNQVCPIWVYRQRESPEPGHALCVLERSRPTPCSLGRCANCNHTNVAHATKLKRREVPVRCPLITPHLSAEEAKETAYADISSRSGGPRQALFFRDYYSSSIILNPLRCAGIAPTTECSHQDRSTTQFSSRQELSKCPAHPVEHRDTVRRPGRAAEASLR